MNPLHFHALCLNPSAKIHSINYKCPNPNRSSRSPVVSRDTRSSEKRTFKRWKEGTSEVDWSWVLCVQASKQASTRGLEQRLRLRERQSPPSSLANPQQQLPKNAEPRWFASILHRCIARSRNTRWPQSVIFPAHPASGVMLPRAINKALMTKAI